MTTTEVLEMNRPMKQRLFDFPGEIRAQKEKAEVAKRALKEAQGAVVEFEAELLSAIGAEVNPNTGKAAYSNAEARAAELIRRKTDNVAYRAVNLAARAAEEEFNAAQFDLERLYDEFRAYRYVVDLTARELALLAVDSHSDGRAASEPQP